VLLLHAVLDHESPHQVDRCSISIALDVEIYSCGSTRDRRLGKYVSLSLSYSQRPKGVMVGETLVLCPFTLLARPEGVRELCDREDTLPVLAPDLVLAHAPE